MDILSIVERETDNPRSHVVSDRADVVAKVVAFALIVVLAFMVLRAFNNPSNYLILFSVAVAAVVFAILGVHLALISVLGLAVSEDHFIPPHMGLHQIGAERRGPISFDDIASAELLQNSTGKLAILKINVLNHDLVVLKKNDYGVSSESFDRLVNGIQKRKRLAGG